MGVPVIYQIDEEFIPKLKNWLGSSDKVSVNFPDSTSEIVENLIKTYSA
jgi:hypothetical protein